MKRRRANALVALSSAAVMTVYTAGFMRTRAAAEKLENSSRARLPVIPVAASIAPPAPIVEPVAAEKAVAPPKAVGPKAIAPKPAAVAKAEPLKLKNDPAEATVAPAIPTEVTPPPAAAPIVPLPELAPSAEVLLGGTELHNGTFLGWGRSRHGDIQASVTIYSGRITAVSIAQCRTQYSCDIIGHLPAKVLKEQTPEKITNVSGATQSVDAFYYAVIDALNKAK